MGFLIVLFISAFLIFKAWLDNRLESGSLDVSFVNSYVQNYLNESYSGLKFNFERIFLVKAEDQDIAILLKGLQVNSNQNGVTLTAVNTELKSGLISSILGPITKLANRSKFNDIRISEPNINLNLDTLLRELEVNLEGKNLKSEQNQATYIDTIEFGDQAVTTHHFYQNLLSVVNTTLSKNNTDQNSVNNFSLENGALSIITCLLYTSPSPRDLSTSRMPSSA